MKVYEIRKEDNTKYRFEYKKDSSQVEIYVNDKCWGVPQGSHFVKALLCEIEELNNKNKLEKPFSERDIEKEVVCKFVDRGMNVYGEYDSESNMHCPDCDEFVGDYESGELYNKYCPECGQKLKYTKIEE